MTLRILRVLGPALLLSIAGTAHAQTAPTGDFHQHLFSPALVALISPAPPAAPFTSMDAAALVRLLDEAGIRKALVLSTAYIWSQPSRGVADDADKVRADNDWTSAQVARFPERLIGFCSVNPLKEYALPEIDRCANDPHLRRGLKLHFGNSLVDYRNPQHLARLREVFKAANSHHMAIVVHMRPSVSQQYPFGANEARIFIEQLLPAAPDVVVQVAHLTGSGGYGDDIDLAAAEFARAFRRGDPRVKHVWIDATTIVTPGVSAEERGRMATRLRQIGVKRILYGSDAATGGGLTPKEGWAAFQTLPLTGAEFRTIAGNVPPYVR